MFIFLLVLHILVAGLLVVSILLQSGQAGGLSGAFGGGGGGGAGNQSLFGGRGAATFLTRATTYLGAGFLVLSFALALVQAHRGGAGAGTRNIIQEALQPTQAPAGPGGAEGMMPGGGQPMPDAAPAGEVPAGDVPEGLLPPSGAGTQTQPLPGEESQAEPTPAAPAGGEGGSGGE